MWKMMEVIAPLLQRAREITCSSGLYVTRRNFVTKPGGHGHKKIDLEPYKTILETKYRNGVKLNELQQWLQQRDLKISSYTIAKRLAEWRINRMHILEPHKEILMNLVREGVTLTETRNRLKAEGITFSPRTLTRALAVWNVIRRPRGSTLDDLRDRIRPLWKQGLHIDEITEILREENCFLPDITMKRIMAELKQEARAKEDWLRARRRKAATAPPNKEP
ncbi:hypothetical protein T440DRAFT_480384 [Plenodomus tracheiphilus IPT5]|uniref:Clr5 domain-containing protein n=1 Tax=Plenodomus tracheiphilus IPT5 TaxID=1408161 RepID=A0A6A7B459_9PLEO|nr:hypothetical protein T440DRAFT_480384 [Plenodomus tracheiphilus IPT5]